MRVVVAMTGATGAVYGARLLAVLRELSVETHLVLSRWAEVTIAKETGLSARELASTASVTHSRDNQGASIASGSFRHDGMVIAPCSMKTLAAIRYGFAQELIVRAADVTLKERRRLVLLTRETPLNDIHLENMLALSRMGAIIAPPVPAFYGDPKTIDDLVDHTVGRVLDLFGLEFPKLKRWDGMRRDNELPSLSAEPRIISGGGGTK
ncbi:polyprenyl P-hydroxybenzoate/phenylacrylic acid decarboxylase-like protein [Bradyrhizobium japonicum USDA 38]|uniref:UbiX family flavin prenyltransferase n=1 Tax=Bradyrhizobium japonicum TaxID=375 RepID=UPI0006761AA5|nr:UbiX family flavin prenyltransferase [Bradyrhizobium japonicum]MCS3894060.1 polyprenyl P-hydroxybenzoate/phenylacrylic acid decarboxylase-like protein [Bradyrhizobium japonicum USDA 38]MCS3946574.1 polyprenyl P-hydroxybenzoate/phenylacrylic acid decarboxylase-like protein [Bradyrhizobium japonicum]MCW2220651.1 polyprenyl P-hydroxybenzoate/phenylacrylic acid decarboxylase-like protein [Bradyrhizobium japonicum]MCW2345265.1 polyprenyl P-hydroxybenzoate/phenylacrylic acid decarboxylase-like pro